MQMKAEIFMIVSKSIPTEVLIIMATGSRLGNIILFI